MRLKALVIAAMFALGVTAAVAVAKPPPGKGKPAAVQAKLSLKAAKAQGKELRCRGGHTLLAGDVQSIAPAEFTMLVKKANKKGRALVGKSQAVAVTDKTKVLRRGPAALTALAVGDRVKVLVRSCRDAEGGAALAAKLVVAQPPKADDEDETTTGTTTESTTTTTTATTTTTTTTTTTSP